MADIKEPAVVFSASGWKQFLQFLDRDDESMVDALVADHSQRFNPMGTMTGRITSGSPNVEEVYKRKRKTQEGTQHTIDCLKNMLSIREDMRLKDIVEELDRKYDIHWNKNPWGNITTVMKNCPNIQRVKGKPGYYHYVGGAIVDENQSTDLTTV